MILVVQGNKSFNDYSVFLNAMGTAMFKMDKEDKSINIYAAGPWRVNDMAMEFAGVAERDLKSRGIRIQFRKVPTSWIKENAHSIDHFAYFAARKEVLPPIVNFVEAKADIIPEVYRF